MPRRRPAQRRLTLAPGATTGPGSATSDGGGSWSARGTDRDERWRGPTPRDLRPSSLPPLLPRPVLHLPPHALSPALSPQSRHRPPNLYLTLHYLPHIVSLFISASVSHSVSASLSVSVPFASLSVVPCVSCPQVHLSLQLCLSLPGCPLFSLGLSLTKILFLCRVLCVSLPWISEAASGIASSGVLGFSQGFLTSALKSG